MHTGHKPNANVNIVNEIQPYDEPILLGCEFYYLITLVRPLQCIETNLLERIPPEGSTGFYTSRYFRCVKMAIPSAAFEFDEKQFVGTHLVDASLLRRRIHQGHIPRSVHTHTQTLIHTHFVTRSHGVRVHCIHTQGYHLIFFNFVFLLLKINNYSFICISLLLI